MHVISIDALVDPGESPPPPRLQQAPEAVPAGFPSPSQDYITTSIDLNTHLIQDITSTFILRVAGDSMIGAGIFDGDEIIVDRSLQAVPGSVVVAVLDGELTIKRLHVASTGVELRSDNPSYAPIRVPSFSSLTIWGVVTVCIHHVN